MRSALLCGIFFLAAAAPFAPVASAVSWNNYTLGDFYDISQATDPEVRAAGDAVVFFGNATGFVISPEGHVVTNYHVYQSFGSSGTVYVEWTGGRSYTRRLSLQLVAASAAYDIALYKANVTNIPYLAVDPRPAQVGEDVFIVGHPNTRSQEVSYGKVLATGITIAGRPSIEYSAQTWWGSSGSPVCDRAGHVLAIHWGWDANGRSNGRLTGVPFNLIVRAVPEIASVVQRYGAGRSVATSRSSGGSTTTTSSSGSVGTLPVGGSANGTLTRTGDLNYFRLDLAARGDLTVTLVGASGTDFDLAVWKWNVTASRRTDEARSNGGTSNETVTVRDASPGTYLVIVNSYDGAGPYRLSSRLDQQTTVGGTASSNGRTIGTAADVLQGSGDWRLYTLTTQPGAVRVNLDSPDGVDFDVYVFVGTRVNANAVVAIGDSLAADESVSFQAQAGTYLILVRSAAGAGRFDLSVER